MVSRSVATKKPRSFRKLGNYGPCSKLELCCADTMLTWDNLESIQSMDQLNKLWGPAQQPTLLEQLATNISSGTRSLLCQGTRGDLETRPSLHLASMKAILRRSQSRLWTNLVDEYKGQAQSQLNTTLTNWIPWPLDQTGMCELEEPRYQGLCGSLTAGMTMNLVIQVSR
jgi:hypothetical protein